MKQKLFSR